MAPAPIGRPRRPRHIGYMMWKIEMGHEELVVEAIKDDLGELLRVRRMALGLTQRQLAGRLESSQSRVAKLERNDPGCSLTLLVKALLSLGLTRRDIGRAI